MDETATPSLGMVFDDHVRSEFQLKDADAAVATMIDDAYLNHVPVATGAAGREHLRRFYADHFIPGWPDDVEVTRSLAPWAMTTSSMSCSCLLPTRE